VETKYSEKPTLLKNGTWLRKVLDFLLNPPVIYTLKKSKILTQFLASIVYTDINTVSVFIKKAIQDYKKKYSKILS
jgi:hypothetical protein